jgi:hypothetical protein
MEEELCGFREVLDLGYMDRRQVAPCGGKLCCEEVCEEIMYYAQGVDPAMKTRVRTHESE